MSDYSLEIEGLVSHKHKLEAENSRLRKILQQISIDCFKVANDEICSEAERRSWFAVGRMAANALNETV